MEGRKFLTSVMVLYAEGRLLFLWTIVQNTFFSLKILNVKKTKFLINIRLLYQRLINYFPKEYVLLGIEVKKDGYKEWWKVEPAQLRQIIELHVYSYLNTCSVCKPCVPTMCDAKVNHQCGWSLVTRPLKLIKVFGMFYLWLEANET